MTIVEAQTHQDLAFLIAQGMLDGFNRHYRLFRESSRYAKSLFKAGNWAQLQHVWRERIAFYSEDVSPYAETMRFRNQYEFPLARDRAAGRGQTAAIQNKTQAA